MSSVGKIRRLLHILEYLQSGRRYHTGELSEFVGVSKRTIFRDLKVLQDSGVQLLYDEAEQGYWIPPSTYLPPTDLTVNETLALLLLGDKLGDSGLGAPFQAAARDAALKLLANLPLGIRNYVANTFDHLQVDLDCKAGQPGAYEQYRQLLSAIEKRKKIRIRYDSLFERGEIQTLLSPYQMLFQRHAWYVIGRSSLHREVRTFHVGRIIDSNLTDDSYEVPPRFSIKRYLGNAWRMIRDEPEVEVIVKFEPQVARNVADVLWHPTQRLVWKKDGTLLFHAQVAGIQEVSWWIQGYGDQAEVLQPASLRELIKTRIGRLMEIYGTLDTPRKKTRSRSTAKTARPSKPSASQKKPRKKPKK